MQAKAVLLGLALIFSSTGCSIFDADDSSKASSESDWDPEEYEKNMEAARAELDAKDRAAEEARRETVPVLAAQYASELSEALASTAETDWSSKLGTIVTFYCNEVRSEEFQADLERNGERGRGGDRGTPDTRIGHNEALKEVVIDQYNKFWQASSTDVWPAYFNSAAQEYGCPTYTTDHYGHLE